METEQNLRQARSYELLRACATYRPGPDAAASIRKAASEVDWEAVVQEAQRHGVIPLLYWNLSRECPAAVPTPEFSRLRQCYVANAGYNLRLSGELLRILELLESEGVQVVPFKGPVLADLLFGNVSLRQFGDLDILVRPNDVRKAKQILLLDGYRPEFELTGKIEDEYIRSEHAFQFQKQATGFVIELHWRFGSRNQVFPVNSKEVWTRLQRRHFQGREIAVLADEDLLLYLCVHGAKHGWERLEWIACVSELIRGRKEICWQAVAQRAARSGAERALHVGLLLASELQPVSLPTALSEAMLTDRQARSLAEEAWRRLFVDEPDHSRREEYRHSFYLRTRERWLDRMRMLIYFSVRVPHPLAKDWRLFRVPASMSFLYYLLRPMRLVREYGFRRLRAMLRPNTTF